MNCIENLDDLSTWFVLLFWFVSWIIGVIRKSREGAEGDTEVPQPTPERSRAPRKRPADPLADDLLEELLGKRREPASSGSKGREHARPSGRDTSSQPPPTVGPPFRPRPVVVPEIMDEPSVVFPWPDAMRTDIEEPRYVPPPIAKRQRKPPRPRRQERSQGLRTTSRVTPEVIRDAVVLRAVFAPRRRH